MQCYVALLASKGNKNHQWTDICYILLKLGHTCRSDVLYGSFRAWIKTADVPGTVGAFFMYENSSEIDMETLSAVNPPQPYFAIHPGLTDTQSGRASALT